MTLYETLKGRRTIRRYKQEQIPKKILEECVDAAHLAPSAMNLQPLEYIVVTENLDVVFETLSWAGYLPDGGPREGERPTTYVVILLNREKRPNGGEYDVGIAAMSIVAVAQDSGLGACILGAVDKEKLSENLKVPDNCEVHLVIALGYPGEKSVAEPMEESIKYWLDDEKKLHVPKRSLKNILKWEQY